MASTGLATFDNTIQETNELLKEIEVSMGWTDRREQSYSALRVVLQALRDRLPLVEAVNLAAQLPMLIRGLFYEGWNVSDVPIKMDKEEFLDRIRENFVYSIDVSISDMVKIVLLVVMESIDLAEAEKIKAVLPKDVADLIKV
ncbi:MAG: DUF2267 domain-containing protein [Patescibacteria group bacterium]|jgi:uncharacterized protein (DUF2267 family)